MSAPFTTAVLCFCVLAGCQEVELEALHGPPPGARAELNRDSERIVITRGAALAIECSYGYDEPCDDIEAISDNESTLRTFRLFLDGLQYNYREGAQPQSGFVVVGTGVGTTRLEVLTEQGDLRFDVEVVAPDR